MKYCFITNIDRFTRAGSYQYLNLKAQLSKYGVQLMDVAGVISEEKKNTLESYGVNYKWSSYSPSHKAEILQAEEAHDEIRRNLTRMIGAEIRYTRLGYWMSVSPHGYISEKIDTDNGKRTVIKPDPERSKWFLRMFELRIQGIPDEEIVQRLNAMGYKSRRVSVRDSEKKVKVIGYKGEVPLTIKQLHRYLEDPIYCGVSSHKWLEKPLIVHGQPIITIDMFNKANRGKITIVDKDGEIKILKNKAAERYLRKQKNDPLYAYKPYVLCDACGGR